MRAAAQRRNRQSVRRAAAGPEEPGPANRRATRRAPATRPRSIENPSQWPARAATRRRSNTRSRPARGIDAQAAPWPTRCQPFGHRRRDRDRSLPCARDRGRERRRAHSRSGTARHRPRFALPKPAPRPRPLARPAVRRHAQRPGQLFSRRKAAAMIPATFGTLATADVILAWKWRTDVLARALRQRHADRGHQVGGQCRADRQPAQSDASSMPIHESHARLRNECNRRRDGGGGRTGLDPKAPSEPGQISRRRILEPRVGCATRDTTAITPMTGQAASAGTAVGRNAHWRPLNSIADNRLAFPARSRSTVRGMWFAFVGPLRRRRSLRAIRVTSRSLAAFRDIGEPRASRPDNPIVLDAQRALRCRQSRSRCGRAVFLRTVVGWRPAKPQADVAASLSVPIPLAV